MSHPVSCPFCGSGESRWHYDPRVPAYYFQCDNIECSAKTGLWPTKESALAAWNSRAGSSRADALLIAAGPDLLEACRSLLMEGRNYSDGTWYAMKRAFLSAGGKF